jgi:D-threo-aldose 1-dehydrogenase
MISLKENISLGPANLPLPRFGLGAAHICTRDFESGLQTVGRAWDLGVRFFDTAPLYGRGLSEQCLGQALAGRPRSDYILATKVGRLIRDNEAVFDFSADGIRRSLEESLERLGLDRIDIVHIHDPHHHYSQALEAAYPVLDAWRAAGTVGAIGVGIGNPTMLADFANNADFDCFLVPNCYSLLTFEALELLDLCHKKGIRAIAGGVFNGGILAESPSETSKYNYRQAPPDIIERARQLDAVCTYHDVELRQAALHFVYGHPAVSSVILGAETPQHVEANLDLLSATTPPDLWQALKASDLLPPSVPVPAA